jgi:HlyD family secretion protein
LELLKSGPTAEAIAAAQADVEQSEAQLNQAQNALENCNITALSDGSSSAKTTSSATWST